MVLTDDQRALQENARSLAHERLLPAYQKREKLGILDRALERELGDLGLPEQYGGMGLDGVTSGLVAEELAYDDFKMSAVPVGVSLNVEYQPNLPPGCHSNLTPPWSQCLGY